MLISYRLWDSFRSSKPGRARRLAIILSVALGLAVFAAVALRHHERFPSSLTDTNAYSSEDVYDADWDQKQLQHNLVRTQRMMTTENKHMDGEIKRLDNNVEDLLKMFGAD